MLKITMELQAENSRLCRVFYVIGKTYVSMFRWYYNNSNKAILFGIAFINFREVKYGIQRVDTKARC